MSGARLLSDDQAGKQRRRFLRGGLCAAPCVVLLVALLISHQSARASTSAERTAASAAGRDEAARTEACRSHEEANLLSSEEARRQTALAEEWLSSQPRRATARGDALAPAGAWFGEGRGGAAVARALLAGRLVRVANPFPPLVAEQPHTHALTPIGCHPHPFRIEKVSRELEALPEQLWTRFRGAVEGFQFQHHHLTVKPDLLADRCPSYTQALEWFRTSFAQWMHNITHLEGFSTPSASWFRPGDFSSPHNDQDDGNVVAFVWHLTRGWDERDGGDFVWCDPYLRFAPTANTLYLFVVRDESDHLVQPVWDDEQQCASPRPKRLAINGWYKLLGGVQPQSLPGTRHIASQAFVFHAHGG
ncbi:hypothetical protein AB1Y20_008902 [Prymnesium parvum]|uniref:Prolyl 3,4-dihydroxylase TPA1/OFD1 N-terminal domain-containing protein n=1 Tax=Prymnesium parvum TaxID=97485 RepID=A0AB34K2A8_PRYPA